ncbi:MAG: hypothetical protein PHT12_00245 [Patescibacteria group bacterium]|nr:hypothetical protein [Patescibacteria group bacterium]
MPKKLSTALTAAESDDRRQELLEGWLCRRSPSFNRLMEYGGCVAVVQKCGEDFIGCVHAELARRTDGDDEDSEAEIVVSSAFPLANAVAQAAEELGRLIVAVLEHNRFTNQCRCNGHKFFMDADGERQGFLQHGDLTAFLNLDNLAASNPAALRQVYTVAKVMAASCADDLMVIGRVVTVRCQVYLAS